MYVYIYTMDKYVHYIHMHRYMLCIYMYVTHIYIGICASSYRCRRLQKSISLTEIAQVNEPDWDCTSYWVWLGLYKSMSPTETETAHVTESGSLLTLWVSFDPGSLACAVSVCLMLLLVLLRKKQFSSFPVRSMWCDLCRRLYKPLSLGFFCKRAAPQMQTSPIQIK